MSADVKLSMFVVSTIVEYEVWMRLEYDLSLELLKETESCTGLESYVNDIYGGVMS